jgi:predicted oxidoreductase
MSSGEGGSLMSIQKSHLKIDRLPIRRTDVKQRVLDSMKQPIPSLYVAGEIISIYGHLYLEAGNITECFVAGKIAGQNAAAE